jgi:hypothetical protein
MISNSMENEDLIMLIRLGQHVDLDDYDVGLDEYTELMAKNVKLTKVYYDESMRASYVIDEDISYRYRNIDFQKGSIAYIEGFKNDTSSVL